LSSTRATASVSCSFERNVFFEKTLEKKPPINEIVGPFERFVQLINLCPRFSATYGFRTDRRFYLLFFFSVTRLLALTFSLRLTFDATGAGHRDVDYRAFKESTACRVISALRCGFNPETRSVTRRYRFLRHYRES